MDKIHNLKITIKYLKKSINERKPMIYIDDKPIEDIEEAKEEEEETNIIEDIEKDDIINIKEEIFTIVNETPLMKIETGKFIVSF